jgi:hypothetical protein
MRVLFQHERLRKGLSQPCQNGVYVLLRNRHPFLLRPRIMADSETSATREQALEQAKAYARAEQDGGRGYPAFSTAPKNAPKKRFQQFSVTRI